jgi:hypothetical protein
LVVASLLVGALVLCGCGGGASVPPGAVAQAGAVTIDRSAFDHWLAIADRVVPTPPGSARNTDHQRSEQTALQVPGHKSGAVIARASAGMLLRLWTTANKRQASREATRV